MRRINLHRIQDIKYQWAGACLSTTPPQHIIISCHCGEDEESLGGRTIQFAISSSGRWDESARPQEGRNEYKAAAEDGNLAFDMDFYSTM